MVKKYNQNELRKRVQENEEQAKKLLKGLAENYTENPEVIAEVIAFSKNFYRYSPNNMMLIYTQNPYATYCQSYDAWVKMGYSVKKGEQGLKIWVPVKTTYLNVEEKLIRLSDATAEQKDEYKQGKIQGQTKTSFRIGNTFDIAQTTMPPEKYPELFSVGYSVKTHKDIAHGMIDYAGTKGYKVVFEDMNSISLRGTCNNLSKVITINSRLKDTQMLSTMCHELGHAMIEHGIADQKTIAQKEIEADAVSIMLESSYGLELTDSRKRHFSQHYQILLKDLKENGKENELQKYIDTIFANVLGILKKQIPEINTCVERYVTSDELINTKLTGEIMEQLRIEKGLGLDEMASVLLLDKAALEKIEKGLIVPTEDTWKMVGDFFRISVKELKRGKIADITPNNISADLEEIRTAMRDIKEDTVYFYDVIASWDLKKSSINEKFYIEKNQQEDEFMYVVVDTQSDTCLKDTEGQVITWDNKESAEQYAAMLEEQETLQPAIEIILEYERSIGRERSMLTELGTEEQIRDYSDLCQNFLEWGQNVDKTISRELNRINAVKVCDTSQILQEIGCREIPMHMTQRHIRDCMKQKDHKGEHYHGLTIEEMKMIPEELANPAMVMVSLTRNDSIIAVMGQKQREGLPIIMSILTNGTAIYQLQPMDSNFITSVYGRKNFEDFLSRVIEADKMLYVNKERSQKLDLPLQKSYWDNLTPSPNHIIKHLDEQGNIKKIKKPDIEGLKYK